MSSIRDKVRPAAIAGIAAAALLLTACAGGGASGSDKKIVFASYGGLFTDAQTKIYFTPYAKKAGLQSTVASGVGFPKLQAMEKSGNVSWDVVTADDGTFPNDVAAGLLEPLDTKIIDTSDIDPQVVDEYGVGYIKFSQNFGWSKDAFPGEKMKPEDFFDPSIKARRSVTGPQGTLEFALLADGVAPDDLYPLDVDRAFAALDRIKPQLVNVGADQETLVQQKEVDMAFISGGRLLDTIKAGANWELSWKDAVSQTEYWAVAKGAPHKTEAMKFIAYAIQAQRQADFAGAIPYGPTNAKAIPLIKPSLASQLPSYPANAEQGVTLDADWWSKNLKSVQARWDAWIAQ